MYRESRDVPIDTLHTRHESRRRRTVAVISHPDAGKSTLTESLLLHAHAVTEAGAVHGKSTRRTTVSDWMSIEQERGISITSAALQFHVGDVVVNLVDTPGHSDFSEDTYRVLSAVDSAIMLIDASKGMEAQTLRLFEVCAERDLPIMVLINKWDRPGLAPLELLDELARITQRRPMPVTWPVGQSGDFRGLRDSVSGEMIVFEHDGSGAQLPREHRLSADEAAAQFADDWETAVDEAELVALDGGPYDQEHFLDRTGMPVFFGSAVRSIGVGEVLRFLCSDGPPAMPRTAVTGEPHAVDGTFSAQVFKIQASMDPAHRDRVAFIRICSGSFTRGMTAVHAQSGRSFATKYALQMFGRDRETVEVAWPGDIVGLVNATLLRPGDTLHDGNRVEYLAMPAFIPELFALVSSVETSAVKKFRKGIQQLSEEGVVQVLDSERRGPQTPLVGAVGQMQFEVLSARMKADFGVDIRLEHLPYTIACPVDAPTAAVLQSRRDCEIVHRGADTFALFADEWRVRAAMREFPDIALELPTRSTAPVSR